MKSNIGKTDRIIRIVAGSGIILAGFYFQSWWGLVGVVPVATAIIRFCPAYWPFGISSDKK